MEKRMTAGLVALTVEDERREIMAAVAGKPRLVLRYHRGSERMGKPYGIDCRLWDVISPRLEGYRYDSDSHVPTLSLLGMRERGLIR